MKTFTYRAETLSDNSVVYNVILVQDGREFAEVYAAPNEDFACSLSDALQDITKAFSNAPNGRAAMALHTAIHAAIKDYLQ